MKTLVAAAGILAVGVCVFCLAARQEPGTHALRYTPQGTVDFASETTYWKGEITRHGAAAAYAELADSITPLPGLVQHIAAHTFGEALYKTEGLPGLAICDARFGQGCVHSFFGLAIQEHGIGSGLQELSGQCAAQQDPSKKRNCEHGIGHGFLSYSGYTPQDLAASLKACGLLNDPANAEVGCYGGAFMEYNDIQTKVDRLVDLLLDGSITKDVHDKKLKQLKARQQEINLLLEEHTDADESYIIAASTVLNLAKRARVLFDSSEVAEKRALLNFLLQNYVVDGKKPMFTLRSPFDSILSVATQPIGLDWRCAFRTFDWQGEFSNAEFHLNALNNLISLAR